MSVAVLPRHRIYKKSLRETQICERLFSTYYAAKISVQVEKAIIHLIHLEFLQLLAVADHTLVKVVLQGDEFLAIFLIEIPFINVVMPGEVCP